MNLEQRDSVFILTLGTDENRFNRIFIDDINQALDEVESSEEKRALVTTGTGKFYSNGLDLDWLTTQTPGDAAPFLDDLDRLFARVLTFPTTTVAAINGHAFAAGFMLSLAHDFRVMRADRGYVCLPEVDLGLPLRPGMTAIIKARLPERAAHEAIVTGRRYGGVRASELGMVNETAAEDAVLERAVAIANELAPKSGPTMTALKRGLYAQALEVLEGKPGK